MADWQSEQRARDERLAAGSKSAAGKMVAPNEHDRAARGGDPAQKSYLPRRRQPEAGGLSGCLSGQSRSESAARAARRAVRYRAARALRPLRERHRKKTRFFLFWPQSHAVPRALKSGKVQLGAIHTYIELFARYFVDLTPHVALSVARSADHKGNLYMGPNTEHSPSVIEATAFKGGIVVAQVNEIVDKLPRVDIPGDRVDFVGVSPKPFYVEPLFTRDPASITEIQILAAMLPAASRRTRTHRSRKAHGRAPHPRRAFFGGKKFRHVRLHRHSIAQQAADTRTRALRISHRPRQCYCSHVHILELNGESCRLKQSKAVNTPPIMTPPR